MLPVDSIDKRQQKEMSSGHTEVYPHVLLKIERVIVFNEITENGKPFRSFPMYREVEPLLYDTPSQYIGKLQQEEITDPGREIHYCATTTVWDVI
jgi:hypothetical protein